MSRHKPGINDACGSGLISKSHESTNHHEWTCNLVGRLCYRTEVWYRDGMSTGTQNHSYTGQ
eukprot:5692136-Prorocentrum_lima.AAC.1